MSVNIGGKIIDYYKGLPSWARGLVVVGGLIFVYIAGRAVYRLVFPSQSAIDIANNNNDIATFSQTQTQTYPASQYDTFANSIWNSVGAVSYDSATVEATLKQMMNNLDVALLIKAYGTRYDYTLPLLGNMGDPYNVLSVSRHIIDGDLFGIYSYRADDVNKDWASKGITYKI